MDLKEKMKKVYLGDSVYAEYDGYGIILTTENGYGASNRIFFEPEVLEMLEAYLNRLKSKPDTSINDNLEIHKP